MDNRNEIIMIRVSPLDKQRIRMKMEDQTGSVYEADVQDLQERFNEFWSIGKELLARLSTIQ